MKKRGHKLTLISNQGLCLMKKTKRNHFVEAPPNVHLKIPYIYILSSNMHSFMGLSCMSYVNCYCIDKPKSRRVLCKRGCRTVLLESLHYYYYLLNDDYGEDTAIGKLGVSLTSRGTFKANSWSRYLRLMCSQIQPYPFLFIYHTDLLTVFQGWVCFVLLPPSLSWRWGAFLPDWLTMQYAASLWN